MSLQNGATIADRYRLRRLIATGGMGQVWEALDTRLNRRVAVKVLKAEYSDDPEFTARFRAEAQTTAKLNNPGIANVFDYGETPDRTGGAPLAYLVMELVDGEPLNSVISRLGRLSLANTLDMLEQTGRALQAAHSAGLVHRDVKPGNILITPTGQVKITDFGIAKAVDSAPVTQTGMVMGTAQYISPEQATGGEATAASDVYSLGVVGYEALTGRRPFLGDGAITIAMKHIREEPPPLPSNIPASVRELIDITLSKDPKQRYANGGEFADAVAAVRAGRRPPRPGTAALGAAGAAAAGAAAGAGIAAARPTGATRAMTAGNTAMAPASSGTGLTPTRTSATPTPPDHHDNGWTTGQKVLAGIAAVLLLGAIGLIGFWVANLNSSSSDTPSPPATVTQTTTATVPTTADDEPTTTRREPTTTTQDETTTETTTEEPTPTQETPTPTTQPDTGAPTVTGRFCPPICLPGQ
ncbi:MULTISPECIES: protein kinase domain-containing protein [unclassified Gordonia (in: high G+C Gram-positive bacteria)]